MAEVGRIRDTSSSTDVAGLLCFLCDLLLVCAGWLPVFRGPWQQTCVSLTAHTVLLLSGGKAALLLPPSLIWLWYSSSLVLFSVIFMLCLLPCFARFDNMLWFLAHYLFYPYASASFGFQIWFSYFEYTLMVTSTLVQTHYKGLQSWACYHTFPEEFPCYSTLCLALFSVLQTFSKTPIHLQKMTCKEDDCCFICLLGWPTHPPQLSCLYPPSYKSK